MQTRDWIRHDADVSLGEEIHNLYYIYSSGLNLILCSSIIIVGRIEKLWKSKCSDIVRHLCYMPKECQIHVTYFYSSDVAVLTKMDIKIF